MEYGINVKQAEADKIVRKLQFDADEVPLFAGKCSNWVPAADWFLVTSERVIATPAMGVKLAWSTRRSDLVTAAGDAENRTLTLVQATGEAITLKKVAVEDQAVVLGMLELPTSAPALPTTDPAPPKAGPSWSERMKQKIDDAQAASKELAEANAATYGAIVKRGQFGLKTVEIYASGHVRVGVLLTKKSPFEVLKSIKFTTQVQDKSAGGRALAGIATMGLSSLTSNEKRVLLLTIMTDKNVHTLSAEGTMGRSEDKLGLALEAAGNSVIADAAPSGAVAPVIVTQAAPEQSVADKIRSLSELHRDGVLSDDEFASAKAKLLGGL